MESSEIEINRLSNFLSDCHAAINTGSPSTMDMAKQLKEELPVEIVRFLVMPSVTSVSIIDQLAPLIGYKNGNEQLEFFRNNLSWFDQLIKELKELE
jgi:hypothetical protein